MSQSRVFFSQFSMTLSSFFVRARLCCSVWTYDVRMSVLSESHAMSSIKFIFRFSHFLSQPYIPEAFHPWSGRRAVCGQISERCFWRRYMRVIVTHRWTTFPVRSQAFTKVILSRILLVLVGFQLDSKPLSCYPKLNVFSERGTKTLIGRKRSKFGLTAECVSCTPPSLLQQSIFVNIWKYLMKLN